jgi:predicted NAD/FAD-binding protein
MVEFSRLLLQSFYIAATGEMANLTGTFGDFLKKNNYSDRFVNQFLLPFLVNVGTCTHTAMLEYPAKIAVHMLSCYRPNFEQVKDGVRNVCKKLMSNVDKVEYNVEVVGAWHNPKSGKIDLLDRTGKRHEFDYVVFATQGLIAKNILEQEPPSDLKGIASPANRSLTACLSKFEYKPIRVVIHTEETVMPLNQKEWRGLNFTTDGKESMASMWINYIYQLPSSN